MTVRTVPLSDQDPAYPITPQQFLRAQHMLDDGRSDRQDEIVQTIAKATQYAEGVMNRAVSVQQYQTILTGSNISYSITLRQDVQSVRSVIVTYSSDRSTEELTEGTEYYITLEGIEFDTDVDISLYSQITIVYISGMNPLLPGVFEGIMEMSKAMFNNTPYPDMSILKKYRVENI